MHIGKWLLENPLYCKPLFCPTDSTLEGSLTMPSAVYLHDFGKKRRENKMFSLAYAFFLEASRASFIHLDRLKRG
jgi:hypothetical protein